MFSRVYVVGVGSVCRVCFVARVGGGDWCELCLCCMLSEVWYQAFHACMFGPGVDGV